VTAPRSRSAAQPAAGPSATIETLMGPRPVVADNGRTMPRLRFKTFATPDEVRPLPNGRAEVVSLDESTVARSVFNPGWRWSVDLAPIMGTRSCQVHHLGHAISGVMRVVTDDGDTLDIPPGSIYEIPPGHDAWVVGDEPWVTVEWTSARIVGIGPEGPGERVLATVLFTDIVDSTARLQELGDVPWQELLRLHNARLRSDVNAFRGREVKTTGDGFLVVFDGATKAVRCAGAMTRSARDLGLAIRVGIHTGEVQFVGEDVLGVAVHAAARVMALAGPGEVLVSSTTRDLLDGSGILLQEAGTHELKGLAGGRLVFRLVTPDGG
jgi:class 3 adenylate cyclase